MLGKELIEEIEDRYRAMEYYPRENWNKLKEQIILEHDYPLDTVNTNWPFIQKTILDEKIKILMKDIC